MNRPVISVKIETWEIGLAMLIIAFWGEPDLIDALIHFLMKP